MLATGVCCNININITNLWVEFLVRVHVVQFHGDILLHMSQAVRYACICCLSATDIHPRYLRLGARLTIP